MSEAMEIGPVRITAYKEQTYGSGPVGGGGYGDDFGNSAIGRKVAANAKKEVSEKYRATIISAVAAQEADYAAKRQLIPGELQKKIEEDKRINGIKTDDRVANLWSEIRSMENVISQTSLDVISLQSVANSFYRRDFFDQPVTKFITEAAARLAYRIAAPETSFDEWQKSLHAAYGVKRLNDVTDVAARYKDKVRTEVVDIEAAIKFTSDFYAEAGVRFGDSASKLASDLADSAQGKKIRSADEAFKAFDKYKNALDKKFSVKDRAAAAKYIDSIDYEAIGKAATKFSKGLGYVGPVIDAKDSIIEFMNSMESGDWKPFFLKLESIALGLAATAFVGIAFGFIATTPMGILAFAFIVAATGAAIDDNFAEKLNKFVSSL